MEAKNKTAYIRTLLQNQGIISDKSYKFAHISLEFYSPANRETFTLSMIESTYYPEGWNLKYEEDLNKSVNKAIAQNEYYSYI